MNQTEEWAGDAQNASPDGEFVRDTNYISDRISAQVTEPTQQDDGTVLWPMEPGRYRLVAARACPWAHRAVIVRRLLGLEPHISLALAGPTHDIRSWTFDLDPEHKDPVLGITRLQDAYFNRFPGYSRGITVPALVEEETAKVVTNSYPTMVRDFITGWSQFHRPGAPNLYPSEHAEEMERINAYIFNSVNNGVYRCGFAGSQESYEEAYWDLRAAIDWIEDRLGTQRFMVGEHITETDVRLFATLVRFDPVYYSHFKCSYKKMAELPNIRGYLQELFQIPGFGDTTDFKEIKEHYYVVHKEINPTGIVPLGPDMDWLMEPHDRDRFGGSPFAEGTTLPGAVPHGEEVKNPQPFQLRLFGR